MRSQARPVIAKILDAHGPLTYAAVVELAYMELGHARVHRTLAAMVRSGIITETREPGSYRATRRNRTFTFVRPEVMTDATN